MVTLKNSKSKPKSKAPKSIKKKTSKKFSLSGKPQKLVTTPLIYVTNDFIKNKCILEKKHGGTISNYPGNINFNQYIKIKGWGRDENKKWNPPENFKNYDGIFKFERPNCNYSKGCSQVCAYLFLKSFRRHLNKIILTLPDGNVVKIKHVNDYFEKYEKNKVIDEGKFKTLFENNDVILKCK